MLFTRLPPRSWQCDRRDGRALPPVLSVVRCAVVSVLWRAISSSLAHSLPFHWRPQHVSGPEKRMSFPTKEVRQQCWDSRDRYWECLDANKEAAEQCVKLRQAYEAQCPAQWVKHFDRKRSYLKFKDRIEKEGYEPLK
ncbi:cytochrome c oxidase assembly factor 6 homolog isoform X1 [Bacillus rossius redtenbacheri]|uniref:cytochrome c oxidase assembly factor 6 homolog isoform X1 n=1 Tax=Bacillus rossius redtenbacheri TaxID=93214 RepID=UPI002FDEBAF7